MWGDIIGSAIQAGGGLAGIGLQGGGDPYRQSKNILKHQFRHQRNMFRKSYNAARNFATKGLSWEFEQKMAMAKKHGIHPLAVLGQQGQSFPGATVGGGSAGGFGSGGDDTGRIAASMGQDIGRAVKSVMTKTEKEMEALRIKQEKLRTEKMGIEVDVAKKQLDDMNSPSYPSENPLGIQGQGDTIIEEDLPVIYENSQLPRSQSIGVSAGTAPLKSSYTDQFGRRDLLLSKDASEPAESDISFQIKNVIRTVNDMYRIRHAWKYPSAPASRRMIRKLKDIKMGLIRQYNIRPGYDLRLDHKWNTWMPVKSKSKRLWYKTSPNKKPYRKLW